MICLSVGCSLATAFRSSLPKLFIPLLPVPLAPFQPHKALLIVVAYIALSRWRIENPTKPMVDFLIGRESSEPSYILNKCEGVQLLCSPYESHYQAF